MDSSIANVDAIQEGHHVDDEEDGPDDEVQFQEQLAFSCWIDWGIIHGRRAAHPGCVRHEAPARLWRLLLMDFPRHDQCDMAFGRKTVGGWASGSAGDRVDMQQSVRLHKEAQLQAPLFQPRVGIYPITH